jgi:CHAT domain-containing protein
MPGSSAKTAGEEGILVAVKAQLRTEVDAILERLLSFDDSTSRHQLIEQNPTLNWDEIISNLAERVWQEVRVDTAQARRTADIAIELAESIGSKSGQAKAFRAKANTLYVSDEHAAAIEMHQRAAALFEQAGEPLQRARTLSSSLQPLLLLGRYDEALAAGDQARAIFAQEKNLWRLARLEINIGNIYHRQDRFSEALAHYQRAYQELLAHDDPEGMAAVLSNLSLCYISLNDFPQALEFHRTARQHCEQKGMTILVAYADYNIAYLYYLRGEYGRAIQMLRDASVSAGKAGDSYQIALCNLDLSEMYLELNLVAEAADLSRQAHESFQQLGFGYEAAKGLAFAAMAASRQGQAFEGIKLFAKAREMFVQDKNQVWPSLIDLYQALVLFNEKRLFEARNLCLAAHDFFQSSAMPTKAALASMLMARISLGISDTASARQNCRTALQELARSESRMMVYQAEFLSGEIERISGNQGLAYQAYQRAREALELLRGSLWGEELKIAFFQNKLEVYENLASLCLESGRQEEAFSYVQQSKSRSLMDRLIQPVQMPNDAGAGQSELVRSIRNLREELNWYYNLIEREQLRPEERSRERIQNLQQEARSRESDLLRALKEATTSELSEAGLAPPVVGLEEIRQSLPSGVMLLEYFSVQDRHLICVLGRDRLEIRPVTLQSRVKKLLQLLQFQLSKFRLDPGYVKAFQEPMLASTQAHLKALYDELILPIRDLIEADHVVFLPHGLLHYVPFHALHDGRKYLIDEFSVSYAPSASVYSLCRTKRFNTSGSSLIFGIEDAQAPSIIEEARALASILPQARLFTGDSATEAVLRSEGPASRIVHIATHGYFRQDNPMFSSIRLGNAYLSLYDLYHLKLPAELVVLSGCATGLNVVTPGDELMGLVRGLLQAGAQSMVLSLWDVHDDSTRQFMIAFYTHLQHGLSKSAAMRGAMQQLREKYAHPYYWAPFTLIGKD